MQVGEGCELRTVSSEMAEHCEQCEQGQWLGMRRVNRLTLTLPRCQQPIPIIANTLL